MTHKILKTSLFTCAALFATSSFAMEPDQQNKVRIFGYKPATENIINHYNEEFKNNTIKEITENLNATTLSIGRRGISVQKKLPDITELTQTKKEKDSGWPIINVYDQGALGSCTSNAMAFCILQQSIKNSKDPTQVLNNPESLYISRLYQYYNTRLLEGKLHGDSTNVEQDNGASMIGSVMATKMFGAVSENAINESFSITDYDFKGSVAYHNIPYDISEFATPPSGLAYAEAFNPNFMDTQYTKVFENFQFKELDDQFKQKKAYNTEIDKNKFRDLIVNALSKNNPVYTGILLNDKEFNFDSKGFFLTPKNMPIYEYMSKYFKPDSGHAMTIVGYGLYGKERNPSDKTNYYRLINSWGGNCGDGGFFYIPEQYINEVKKADTEAIEVWLNK